MSMDSVPLLEKHAVDKRRSPRITTRFDSLVSADQEGAGVLGEIGFAISYELSDPATRQLVEDLSARVGDPTPA